LKSSLENAEEVISSEVFEWKSDLKQVPSKTASKEDYALRQVPPTWRYPWSSLVVSLLGGATSGFFLAFPGDLAHQFGLGNVLIGMIYALILQTILNYVFVKAATRTGLSADLMSRGLALGFDGAAWTTIVYWFTWLTFFSIEGQILGDAINAQFGIPKWGAYIIVGGGSLPLVLYGFQFLYQFQRWTLYAYALAMIALIVKVFSTPHLGTIISSGFASSGSVSGLGFLGVIAAYNGLIGNVTLGHVDVARLGATSKSLLKGSKKGMLWFSLIPYSLAAYVVFGLLGLLFWLVTKSNNPGAYFVSLLGIVGFLLVIITQLRINLINAYSGSISLANFFSKFNFLPGRSFWAIVMVVMGTAMMFGNVLSNLGKILTFEGVFLAAWIGVIFSDLVVNRGIFQFGPQKGQFIEYRRALVKNWNFVGVVPMIIATIVGSTLVFGGANGMFGGTVTEYLASFITFVLAGIGTIILGRWDRGASYNQRQAIKWSREDCVIMCPIDHEIVSTEDLVPCPHFNTWICSHDCMATKDCGTKCASMPEKELKRIPMPEPTPSLVHVNQKLGKA
jgi:cytosine permease